MTPDGWLIVISALLATAGYLLWVAGRVPRGRRVLALLALVTFVASVVVHDAITNREAERGTATFDDAVGS